MTGQITIQLTHFEGPLALLLYLIRKDEMDIMDIKIHEITTQYLEYIKLMKELDIEVAGDFIAMASTLIHIKSRMLLPTYNEAGEVVENEDPRKELVQKLLEYQKYQEAAKLLYERPLVGRDVWTRGLRERLAPKEEEIELDESGLFGLISSYRKMLRAAQKRVHKVAAKTMSIAGRILQMRERLIVGVRMSLKSLVLATEDRARETLITFLSLLELGKMGFVHLAQNEPYSDIWLVTQKPIELDALSRVEEYDNLHSQEVADRLVETTPSPDSGEDFALMTTAGGEQLVFEGEIDGARLLDEIASDEEILAAETAMKDEGNSEV